ncbi:cellulase [Pedococcus aerophilus]|uniref:Cellulase n=1 Tax=Pedococcus aerophilus TaxID=436356 RepID=A0ABP6GV72_9MICO
MRLNQMGYPRWARKVATVLCLEQEPQDFVVEDRDGREVLAGMTRPWPARPEPTSGFTLHLVDFSTVKGEGSGYRVRVGELVSHAFPLGANPHAELADEALHVFRLMRSGDAVPEEFGAHARPAGHLGVAPNTGDTAVPAWTGPEASALYPGWTCPGTFDVSGGWYDAGDHGKYVTSGSTALWQLLMTLDLLGDLLPSSTREALVEECHWQLEWVCRMQVPTGSPLAGMAFHKVHGTTWSPLPGLPHVDPTVRVLHRPSTSATWHLAAVAAQGARVLRAFDRSCAVPLLATARRAAAAVAAHPHLAAPAGGSQFGGGPYGDADTTDDEYWATVELWLAGRSSEDLTRLQRSPWHHAEVFSPLGFDFDAMAAPARLDLSLHGTSLEEKESVDESVVVAAERLVRLQEQQAWGQPYAPDAGWTWGSNGRLLNNLVVIAVGHHLAPGRVAATAVAEGLDHVLGRNALGQCYVTGFGVDDSRRQRTRLFGQALDPALPPPPRGALAGGANSVPSPGFHYDDRLRGLPPQWCYLDEPTSEVTNDVCIRWNAALVFVAAWLAAQTRARNGPAAPST